MHQRVAAATTALLASLALALGAAAAPIAPGYIVSFVTTPDAAAGDVVVAGGALFVGSGAFGVGNQSLVRIDGGGTTVLASGFNSLGGMVYDSVNDRLLTGDNGGNGPGAVTGDTIYAIPNPFGSPGTPASAASLELLPMGSVPGYSDIVLDPTDATGNTAFVGDASTSFPPTGVVLEVAISSATTSVLQSGLDFTAGLAADGGSLYVGESLLDFSGLISGVALANPGAPLSTLAAVALGQFDLEVSSDGTLISSAGGSILRVDPSDGSQSTVATGFGFTGGIFEDTGTGVIYALDGFAAAGEENRVWVLTPVPEPGSALLCSLGLAGLAMRRRQSRAVSRKTTGTATRP